MGNVNTSQPPGISITAAVRRAMREVSSDDLVAVYARVVELTQTSYLNPDTVARTVRRLRRIYRH